MLTETTLINIVVKCLFQEQQAAVFNEKSSDKLNVLYLFSSQQQTDTVTH